MNSKCLVFTIGIVLLSLAGVFGLSSVLASPSNGSVNFVTMTTPDITGENARHVILADEFTLQVEETSPIVVTVTVPITALGMIDEANIMVANQFMSKRAVITTIGGHGLLYLPIIIGPPPEWERMPTDGWPQQDGEADRALALAVCTQNGTTTAFAGTRNGVFSTTNNTWVREQSNNLPTNGAVVTGLAAKADCSEVYAAIYDSGIWHRNVNGSWQQLGGSEVAFVRSIALATNGRLFAGGAFDLRYWESGAWLAANVLGDSARPIMHLSVSPSGSVYAVRWNTDSIWRLAPNATPATDWQIAATLPANYAPTMLAVAGNGDGSLLEIGTLDAHYQWRNGQWQSIHTQETRALSVIDMNQVYAGYAGNTGVYLSESGGAFVPLNPGWAIPEKVYQLILMEGKLYAGTTNGVWTLSRSD